jgi:multicomponent Na+:H+ antiporter subunit D
VLACSNGIALVRDIFSLYVFIEITSIVSFILISFNRERDNLEGAFKYIVLSAVASVLMLTSIALILFISGDTSFALVSLTLATTAHNYLVLAAVGLFLCGLFIKSGLVPFHGWLADAYVAAPAAVSVLLAGIVTKAVGVYALMRLVVDVFPFTPVVQNILFCAGLFSVLLGAFAALAQNDFKRMLSYSSISQVGYIVLGLAAGNPLGLAAAVFHFFNHAVFKSLLFVNCASIEKQIGFRNMDRLGGLAQRMPITGISSAIASLSCAGLPPLAGFWSKLLIIIALWSSGHYFVSLTAALASVLTLAYMLSMQRRVFFGKLREGFLHFKEPAPVLSLAALILTAITIGVGIFFPINLCRIILP